METIFERRMNMEKETNKELLEDVIKAKIKNLKNISPGSEGYLEEVEAISKLYKLNIEEMENERTHEIKQTQISDERKARYWKNGIEIGGIILPLAFYGLWMKRGFKFEESGVFTSTTFKNLFSKFKPH